MQWFRISYVICEHLGRRLYWKCRHQDNACTSNKLLFTALVLETDWYTSSRRRWVDNIKMDLGVIECGGVHSWWHSNESSGCIQSRRLPSEDLLPLHRPVWCLCCWCVVRKLFILSADHGSLMKGFLFPHKFSNLLSSGYRVLVSPEVKHWGREADHLPPLNAGVRNTWAYPLTPVCVFMTWCLIKLQLIPHVRCQVNSREGRYLFGISASNLARRNIPPARKLS
jgi:hypothetical protein